MKLIKGPYNVLLNGQTLNNVTKFEWKEGELSLSFFPTDQRQANKLINNELYVPTVTLEGCGSGMVHFYIKGDPVRSITVLDFSVVVIDLKFKTQSVKFDVGDDYKRQDRVRFHV